MPVTLTEIGETECIVHFAADRRAAAEAAMASSALAFEFIGEWCDDAYFLMSLADARETLILAGGHAKVVRLGPGTFGG